MSLANLPHNFRHIRNVARSNYDAISLGQLLRASKPDPESLLNASRWLHEQLPIRFARRIEDFIQLPHVVVSNPQFNKVLQNYLDTFNALSSYPEISTQEQVVEFRMLLSHHTDLHGFGSRYIADGYSQVRRLYPDVRLDTFLHTFFVSRIATRILIDNYMQMHEPKDGHYGIVRQNMSPLTIAMEQSKMLKSLTKQIYGIVPEVKFRGNIDCSLDYIPRHVSYMIQEVLKNALRATVERHQASGGCAESLPAVRFEFQKGDVHVIIKISDQGGGLPKHMQKEAWEFGWTTVAGGNNFTDASTPRPKVTSELAGFGFGLPLTRLHAQYFGGDVFMQALPGHGTDMYILLTHLKESYLSTEGEDLASVIEKGPFKPVCMK